MTDIEVPMWPIKLRFKGDFDFTELFNFTYHWFRRERMEYHEKLYKDKVDTPNGNEIEVEMEGWRKTTEYIRHWGYVRFHLWEAKEVIVVVNGQQKKMMRGRIEVRIFGKLETDWQKRFKDYPKLITFLEKVVMRRELEFKYIEPFDRHMHALAKEIKDHFHMEMY